MDEDARLLEAAHEARANALRRHDRDGPHEAVSVPGKCIFCPTDVRMPKSYLADEPGAMRGPGARLRPIRAGAVARCTSRRSGIQPIRSSCLFSGARGPRTVAITRRGSSSAASMQ